MLFQDCWHEAIDDAFIITDDTLREGLQSPDAKSPSDSECLEILDALDSSGIERAIVGFPASGENALRRSRRLLQHPSQVRLGFVGRMLHEDVDAICRVRDDAGRDCDAYLYRAFSTTHLQIDGEILERRLEATEQVLGRAVSDGLSVRFVIEDATRTETDACHQILDTLGSLHLSGIVLADTVGIARPSSLCRQIHFFQQHMQSGPSQAPELELHVHNDRGLALANALTGWEAGATVLHGTVLGAGERVGNAPTELLAANRCIDAGDLSGLSDLSQLVALVGSALDLTIDANHPLWGGNAFSMVAGAHAAPVAKAHAAEKPMLASLAYQFLEPALLDGRASYHLGPNAGRSIIVLALGEAGVKATSDLVDRIMAKVKAQSENLDPTTFLKLVREMVRNESNPRRP